MSSDKYIDKLFRDKLENREFELSEDSWKAAAKLIIADGKKVAWFGGKFWFGLSVVAVIALMLPFVVDNEQEKLRTSIQVQNVSEQDVIFSEQDELIAEQKNIISEQKNLISSQKSIIFTQKDLISEQNVIISKHKDIASVQDEINQKQRNIAGVQHDIISEQDENVSEKNNFIQEQIDITSEHNDPIFGQGHKSEIAALAETVYLPLEEMDYLSFPGFHTQGNSPANQLSAGQQPFKDRLNWLRRSNIGIIAGANISQGFVNGEARVRPSVRPLAGIRFAYSLNHMVSIGMNALYHIRGGLNSEITASDLSDAQSQGLNEYTSTTTTTLSLHYLDFPLFLQYRKNRHAVVIGLQYSYLLTTYSKVNNVRQNTSGGILSDETSREWGNKDAFLPDDVQGLLGYEWAWNEKFDVGVRFNYGLFDITDDQSFGTGTSIDKNLQIRAMITYKLLRY